MTREVLPREIHYRNVMSIQAGYQRPTLDVLHGASPYDKPSVRLRCPRRVAALIVTDECNPIDVALLLPIR